MGSLRPRGNGGVASGHKISRRSWTEWPAHQSHGPLPMWWRLLVPRPHPGCSSLAAPLCFILGATVPPPKTRSPQLCPEMSRRGTEDSTARRGCVPAGEGLGSAGGPAPTSVSSQPVSPAQMKALASLCPGCCPCSPCALHRVDIYYLFTFGCAGSSLLFGLLSSLVYEVLISGASLVVKHGS